MAGPARNGRGVEGDPAALIRDHEGRTMRTGGIPDHDRRSAVGDGVGKGLLRHPKHGELDVRRRAAGVRSLEADLPARCLADAGHEPFERRPGAQLVEDREAKVPADFPEAVGDRSRERSGASVAGRVETADQDRHLLQRIVVKICSESSALDLGRSHDGVALGPEGLDPCVCLEDNDDDQEPQQRDADSEPERGIAERDHGGIRRRGRQFHCHVYGMVTAMRTTIDTVGRLVIPRSLRDRIGLAGGGEVELELDGAAIRIEPVGGSSFREKDGLLVIPAAGTSLTGAAVRELIDADRHGR